VASDVIKKPLFASSWTSWTSWKSDSTSSSVVSFWRSSLSVEPMILSVVRWWHFMQLKLMQRTEKAKCVHKKRMTCPISYRSATVTHIAFANENNENAWVHTVSYLTQQQTCWRALKIKSSTMRSAETKGSQILGATLFISPIQMEFTSAKGSSINSTTLARNGHGWLLIHFVWPDLQRSTNVSRSSLVFKRAQKVSRFQERAR
jgi:hypothetical protein